MNNSGTKSMTEGRPLPLIISFALPLMLGNIFQQMYTVVDTMVVGKTLQVGALAALGASDWLNWLVLGVLSGLAQGFGILIAQQFGAKQYAALRQTAAASLLLSAISAAVLVLLGQLAITPVLKLLQTPSEILPDSALYLRIMFAGIPVVLAYNLFAAILRSLGDGKTPLYAMIVASITNIVLDILFVPVFGWGIAGAAIATVIAQAVSGIYCLLRLRQIPILRPEESRLAVDGALLRRLLFLGMPMAMQNAIIAVGGMIIQSVVNGFGVTFIAGYTAANKMYGLLEMAAISFGYAMVTYVGQNLGAGKHDRIRRGVKTATALSIVISMVICAVMLVLGKWILGGFISGEPETAARAMDIAYEYLTVMSLCLPVLYILHVVRSAIQGMGNTVLPMVSGISEFVMRTGGVLLLPALISYRGVFWAEVLAWLGADLILVPGYFYLIRKLSERSREWTL